MTPPTTIKCPACNYTQINNGWGQLMTCNGCDRKDMIPTELESLKTARDAAEYAHTASKRNGLGSIDLLLAYTRAALAYSDAITTDRDLANTDRSCWIHLLPSDYQSAINAIGKAWGRGGYEGEPNWCADMRLSDLRDVVGNRTVQSPATLGW